jgi:hypothetical protein
MKMVHLKNLLKASSIVVAGAYVYFLTTETFSDFFTQHALDSARPMAVATGLCAIAVVYIGLFQTATRFIEGVLLLATCVIASWVSCRPLNVVEPDINGTLNGVVFGVESGLTVAIMALLWCVKPRLGKERKWLLLRSGAMVIACVLTFGAIGWWRTRLTGLDSFMALVYPLSFSVVFVCAWLAAGPTALTVVNRKT